MMIVSTYDTIFVGMDLRRPLLVVGTPVNVNVYGLIVTDTCVCWILSAADATLGKVVKRQPCRRIIVLGEARFYSRTYSCSSPSSFSANPGSSRLKCPIISSC